MPYFLSQNISEDLQPMWGEGPIYKKNQIYSISDNKLPPVNYDSHCFKPHSLTHLETPAHTEANGRRLDYFLQNHSEYFYGPCTVLKVKKLKNSKENIWRLTSEELKDSILSFSDTVHKKILISPEVYPIDTNGFHEEKSVFVLDLEAAKLLVNTYKMHLFGTSWKSADYQPGKMERPIHNELFKGGLIMENLNLLNVPPGNYFLSAMPIQTINSSETLVSPILFTKDEISNISL